MTRKNFTVAIFLLYRISTLFHIKGSHRLGLILYAKHRDTFDSNIENFKFYVTHFANGGEPDTIIAPFFADDETRISDR